MNATQNTIAARYSERHISTFKTVGYWRENGSEGRGKLVFTESCNGHQQSVIVDRKTGLVLRLFDWEWFDVPQRTDEKGNAVEERESL